ncbi:MAG: YccF domain-containing protein [Spirochaetaceae bacterium]|nr:MAG: YccF domain-containing protein [Spirochaetaceae bacterium]
MSLIGNIVWILLGGLPLAIAWAVIGAFWFVTIIGIPIGRQCFKLAGLQLAPFGKRVIEERGGGVGLIANIFWLIFGGLELAIANLIVAVAYAVTIIGLPLAAQSLKLAQLSLAPFGKRVVRR